MTNYHSDRIYRLTCGWLDARHEIRHLIYDEIVNSIKRADRDRLHHSAEYIQSRVLENMVQK